MAVKEQVNTLRQGAAAWNAWRKEHPSEKKDLRGADLGGADLRGADLSEADLYGANLDKADLSEADLGGADLRGANLRGANLRGASLYGADLSEANLYGANLYGVNLRHVNLYKADCREADLSRAKVGWTIFGNLDLRTVKGLEVVQHGGPSVIGTDTLERSEGDIPDVFLHGAGLNGTFITYAHSLVHPPIQYYNCFISYSSKDKKFAERLHADLQEKGIRCWYAPKDLKIGEEFPDRIEEAIRFYDKLLIILSHHSIDSSWVKKEVRAAQEKEEDLKKSQPDTTVLFPIKIDTSIEGCQLQWVADLRRERHIGDFTRWRYHARYEEAFQLLLRDMQPEQYRP